MISYAPLWKTMDNKGITTYALIAKYGIASKTVYNLKHNMSITMFTLSKLCRILDCTPNDVVAFSFEDSNN
ncbi:MAG: helix-turn-helix transcriptional regulator [Lachnospiraceae bacterium]|nr:helix-turn-helix transcriptional regulator [Lachnospiraceae bacterium]